MHQPDGRSKHQKYHATCQPRSLPDAGADVGAEVAGAEVTGAGVGSRVPSPLAKQHGNGGCAFTRDYFQSTAVIQVFATPPHTVLSLQADHAGIERRNINYTPSPKERESLSWDRFDPSSVVLPSSTFAAAEPVRLHPTTCGSDPFKEIIFHAALTRPLLANRR